MSKAAYLPDVNVLIALSDTKHSSHAAAARWHESIGNSQFYLCPFTESAFVRLMATPAVGGKSVADALQMLDEIGHVKNVTHRAVAPSMLELISPIAHRLHGYRQVTDALLLGLAIRNKCTLVTFDRAVAGLAGKEFVGNLLVLH